MPHATSQWENTWRSQEASMNFQKTALFLAPSEESIPMRGFLPRAVISKTNSHLSPCLTRSGMVPNCPKISNSTLWGCMGHETVQKRHSTLCGRGWPSITSFIRNIYPKWTNIRMGTWLRLSPDSLKSPWTSIEEAWGRYDWGNVPCYF